MRTLALAVLCFFLCDSVLAQQPTVKKLYYPNGKLRAEMGYIGETPSGFFREYTEKGQVRVEEYYINGKMDSVRREYYESGQLKSEARFRNGLRQGEVREFYEDGKIQSRATYRNDTLISFVKYYFYHPNGRLREETAINARGLLEGTKRTYHNSGALEIEENYVNGERTGEWRQYAANGLMKVYRTYKDGRRDGEEYIYSEEGKLEEINTYREGEKIHVKRYDDKGNLVEELDERAILRQLRR